MNKLFLWIIIALFCKTGIAQNDNSSITIGKTVKIESSILKENRILQIHLPDDYEETNIKYPVMFLIDGPDHFNYTATIVDRLAGFWHHMPKMIIIGISNTVRNRDLLPNERKNIPNSGGADKFIKFFNEELIPYINREYRAANYRILFGHSFGGAFALYTLTSFPDMFDAYIVCGSGHQRDTSLLPYYTTRFKSFSHLNKFLYITIGEEDKTLLDGNTELKRVLESYAPNKLKWEYHLLPFEDHCSAPLNTINNGLRSLFIDWYISPFRIKEEGAKAFKEHLSKLRAEFPFKVVFPEPWFYEYVDMFIENKRYDDAKAFIDICIDDYPLSPNPYKYLGDIYMKTNQKEKAILNFKKYLELVPNDQKIQNKIKELSDKNKLEK